MRAAEGGGGIGGRRLAIRLHAGAERAVRRGHPWVFAEGIRQQRHEGHAGDLAVVFDRDNRFLAIGLYDPASPIRIRILHRGSPETIDGDWFAARISAAYECRRPLLETDTTAFRIVHGENDGLPGLVVDQYGDSMVVKLYSSAWLPHLDDVVAGLTALFNPERIVLRLSRAVERTVAGDGDARDARDARDGRLLLHGDHDRHPGSLRAAERDGRILHGVPLDGPVLFQENGFRFEADLVRGQKTGFFLDQRDNRARVEQYAAGKSVLNVFAYTGGFSVYAARGGALSVTSLDISAPALAAAERNFLHNQSNHAVAAAQHRVVAGDAFDVMPAMRDQGERFDIVILDPPSFAKAQAEVERALVSYSRIIRMGLDVLTRGGLLVAASCSSRITSEQFRGAVEDTTRKAGRSIRILQQTGHPIDHPVGFAEGEYLKCIFADVG